MMRAIFSLVAIQLAFFGFAQTTEYETGQLAGDPWTGWSTPVTTNCTGTVNGANVYSFTGSAGQNYTLETYRQFNINSNDIDVYLTVTAENATVSVEYSSDNTTYTQIGSQNWGSGFGQSTLVIPTYDPMVSTFYLKIKVSGTFGSPSNCQLNDFKIDAVLNTSSVEEESVFGTAAFYQDGYVNIESDHVDYTVTLTDLHGRLINYGMNIKVLDMTTLEQGFYLVTVIHKDGLKKTFKFNHK